MKVFFDAWVVTIGRLGRGVAWGALAATTNLSKVKLGYITVRSKV